MTYRVNLSVAIVAMTANQNHTMDNGTIAIYPDFTWDSTTKGLNHVDNERKWKLLKFGKLHSFAKSGPNCVDYLKKAL